MARSLRSSDKNSQRTPSRERPPSGRILRSASQQPANDAPVELPTSNTSKRRKRGKSVSSTPSTPRAKRKQPKRATKAVVAPSPIVEEAEESEEPSSTIATSTHEDVIEVDEPVISIKPTENHDEPEVVDIQSEVVVESQVVVETTATSPEASMEDVSEPEPEPEHYIEELTAVEAPVHEDTSSSDPPEDAASVAGATSEHQSESEQEQEVIHQSIEAADEPVTVENTEVSQTYTQPSKAPQQFRTSKIISVSVAPTVDIPCVPASCTSDLISCPVTPPGELDFSRAPTFMGHITKTSKFFKDLYVQSRLPTALPWGLSRWLGLDFPTHFPDPSQTSRDTNTMWTLAEELTNVERTAIMVEQFGRIKELEEANRKHVEAAHERIAKERELKNNDRAAAETPKYKARPFDAKERYDRLCEREESLKRKREEHEFEMYKLQKKAEEEAAAQARRKRLILRVSGKDIIIAGAHSQREVDLLSKMAVSKAAGNYTESQLETYHNMLDNSTYQDKWDLRKIHVDWTMGNWPYSQKQLEQAREECRRKGWRVELPPTTFDQPSEPDLSTIEEGQEDEDLPSSPKKARTSLNIRDHTSPAGVHSSPFQDDVDDDSTPRGWTGSLRSVIGSVRKYIPTFSRSTPKTAPVRRSRPMVNRTPLANIHDTARVPQQRNFSLSSPASPTEGRGRRQSETTRNTLANTGSPSIGRYPTDSPAPTVPHNDESSRPEAPRPQAYPSTPSRGTEVSVSETPGNGDGHEIPEAPHTEPSKITQKDTAAQNAPRTAPPRRRLGPAAVKARQDRLARQRVAEEEQAQKDARAAERARIEAARIRSEEADRLEQTGEKRKARGTKTRRTEARAADGGIGMPENFYSDSDSDDESFEHDQDDRVYANKRPKTDFTPIASGRKEAVEAFAGVFSTPGRSKSTLLEDPLKPAPYMGTMFATAKDVDTSANVFMKHQTIQDKAAQMEDSELSPRSYGRKYGVWTGPKEKTVQSSNTFTVPDSSDDESGSDNESTSEQETPKAAPTATPVPTTPTPAVPATTSSKPVNFFASATPPFPNKNIFAQSAGVGSSPPKEPALPSPKTPKMALAAPLIDFSEHDTAEAVARARAEIEKYKPKTPSGLRMADRIASSPNTSMEQIASPQKGPITPPAIDVGDDVEFWEGFKWPKGRRLPTPEPEVKAIIDAHFANLTEEELHRDAAAEWADAWANRPTQ